MSRESHPSSTAADRPAAVLVGVQLQGVSGDELASSLDELERLTETLGLRVIGRVTQKRGGLGSANLLGEGKLRELAKYTGGPGFVPPFVVPGSHGASETEEVEEYEAEEEEDGDTTPQAVTVIVDHDLSPTQLRNLEKVTSVEVLDRSMVILSIFQRHARTREAKLQVCLLYTSPSPRDATLSRMPSSA